MSEKKCWKDTIRHIHETVVKKWDPYSDEDFYFLTLALGGEVGELQNFVKKRWRGDALEDPTWKASLAEELADIRIYLELVAMCLDIDINKAVWDKIPELLERWPEAKR